ncbi:MAG: hypothetical protein HQL09_02110 [Nitrospirae bacterium]|nr:hypothetical protein [Nitrospirota bacterium]
MIHSQSLYRHFIVPGASQLAVAGHLVFDDVKLDPKNENRFVVVPVAGVDKTSINGIRYAKRLSGNIFAVHILFDPSDKDRIEREWKTQDMNIPLIILESPNNSIIGPLTEYIDGILLRHTGSVVTVVLPVIATSKWWHRFLFNQTARLIERAFEGKAGVATIRIPFSLTDTSH